MYNQGSTGLEPVHGRFITEVISSVQGVWRIRMDECRIVAAVQRDGGRTWFEVLDFSQGQGDHMTGLGDGSMDMMDQEELGHSTDEDEDGMEDE